MTDKKIVRIEIEYEDGSMLRLTGLEDCQKWDDMSRTQATMAHVHGMRFEPLNWEELKSGDENG